MVSPRAQDWVDTHPETPLLRRCWDNDAKYANGERHLKRGDRPGSDFDLPWRENTPEDKAKLAEWVRITVRDSPRLPPWHDWPARFVHAQPPRGGQVTVFKRI